MRKRDLETLLGNAGFVLGQGREYGIGANRNWVNRFSAIPKEQFYDADRDEYDDLELARVPVKGKPNWAEMARRFEEQAR